MIIPIELRFKADKDSKSAFRTDKTIKSHDVNTVEFHISIDGLELADNHTAKILSIFHTSKSQVNVDCEIVEGKIIYKPDTNLISRYEHVTNYVYVYHNNQSLDVCEFIYIVNLSKIDETSLEVKEVYDQSYADLLADFEQALSDYKDNLPQADSVRADIDEILNQFSEDSRAKLSQYDADAQQVIADNQTAFGLAETGRQDSYEQAESERNQSSNQALADWEQGADAIINVVEDNESARVGAEATRKTNETDRVSSETTRKTNETTRISNENARKSAESVRVANEGERELNEAERISKDSERDSKIDGKANKSMLLSPKYDLVCDSCVRDINTPLDAYSVPMESGHYFENVEDRNSDTTLTYEPDGILLVSPTVRNDLSPVLIKDFGVDFPYFYVRAKHLRISNDTRFWFIKYKDKDNWVGIKVEKTYQTVLVTTSVEGIQTNIAVEDTSSFSEYQASSDIIYTLKAEIIGVHSNFAKSEQAVRVFKNEQRVFTVPIPTNSADFPNRVGFSVGSQTEILNFKAGRSS